MRGKIKSVISKLLARPGGFEPPTPRFVGWPSTLIVQQNFANQIKGQRWGINDLRGFCKPAKLESQLNAN
jgi:hypothetical protein